MRFSSFPMGKGLGLEVRAPYMDPEVVEFSRGLSKAEKVAEVDGVVHGKLLLRLAFPEVENRWRRKDPIEVGSGSRALTAYFRDRVREKEYREEVDRIRREEGVTIRDPEHLAYYQTMREVFRDSAPVPRRGKDPCRECGFDLPDPESDFCVTCGAWPAREPRTG
jgi:asparagine synthase (glutamine-hydrolysing)